LRIKNQFWF